jgi:hypothetical protein
MIFNHSFQDFMFFNVFYSLFMMRIISSVHVEKLSRYSYTIYLRIIFLLQARRGIPKTALEKN